jgi:hypothetical protein
MAQMGDVEAAEVPQFDALQLGSEPLARVQLRGIGWQAL